MKKKSRKTVRAAAEILNGLGLGLYVIMDSEEERLNKKSVEFQASEKGVEMWKHISSLNDAIKKINEAADALRGI